MGLFKLWGKDEPVANQLKVELRVALLMYFQAIDRILHPDNNTENASAMPWMKEYVSSLSGLSPVTLVEDWTAELMQSTKFIRERSDAFRPNAIRGNSILSRFCTLLEEKSV